MEFMRSNRAFALVEHLDVTTKRKGGDRPLRLIWTDTTHVQRRAESDRKAQYLDATPARD